MNERTPPAIGRYGTVELMESIAGRDAYAVNMFVKHITAEQAREAAHLFNQLAEYLEWQERQR